MIDAYAVSIVLFGWLAYQLSDYQQPVWLFVSGIGAGILLGVAYLLTVREGRLLSFMIIEKIKLLFGGD